MCEAQKLKSANIVLHVPPVAHVPQRTHPPLSASHSPAPANYRQRAAIRHRTGIVVGRRIALPYRIGCCSEMWALPPQPYSRHEKQRWRLRTPRSTIVRLPSGSSASRSATFRSGPSSFGGGTAHPCTGAYGGSSAHHHFASDFSFGVSLCIHPHKRTAKLGRNTSLRFAAHLCGGCPIPPHSKSTAPWILRLARPR